MVNKALIFFIVLVLYLLTYSGLIKWAFFGVDPTLILAFVSLVFIPVVYGKLIKIITSHSKWVFLWFILLHLILFASMIYTISDRYYLEKAGKILLNLYIFLLGLTVFQYKNAIRYLLLINKIFLTLTIALLLVNYAVNQLDILRFRENEGSLYPEYMSVSYYLAIGILLLIPEKKSIFNYGLLISGLFIMLVLAAKGPIFFLLISYLFYLVIGKSIFSKENFKKIMYTLVFLIVVVALIWTAPFLKTFKSRLFFLSGTELDESSLQRVMFLEKSLVIIKDEPILGVGLGGFGKAFTGFDQRLSAHNLIFEVFTEAGLMAFICLIGLVFVARRYLIRGIAKIRNTDMEQYGKMFFALMILILLQSLVASYLEDSRISYFWLAVAIAFFIVTPKNSPVKQINLTGSEVK